TGLSQGSFTHLRVWLACISPEEEKTAAAYNASLPHAVAAMFSEQSQTGQLYASRDPYTPNHRALDTEHGGWSPGTQEDKIRRRQPVTHTGAPLNVTPGATAPPHARSSLTCQLPLTGPPAHSSLGPDWPVHHTNFSEGAIAPLPPPLDPPLTGGCSAHP
ncbi:hypothetical protein AB205_0160410, partial [Aquarana catesbeiana]